MKIRAATREDVPSIVALLADDMLGAARENPGPPLDPGYMAAFDAVEAQSGNTIYVGTDDDGRVLACLQLVIMPGLSHRGASRAEIEAVRVSSAARGTGLGEELVRFAIDQARAAGCRIVQLTSNKTRTSAHRFYARLGFEMSHVGMKLILDGPK